jgi:hypothetical protein
MNEFPLTLDRNRFYYKALFNALRLDMNDEDPKDTAKYVVFERNP